jgi:hypothetical protein
MNIEEAKRALKAGGFDPDALSDQQIQDFLKSPKFLRSDAEEQLFRSKYREAVATAGWPKCVDVIEEAALAMFDEYTKNWPALLTLPDGLELYAKAVAICKRRIEEEFAETALRPLLDGDKTKAMARIRLRLSAREGSAVAQAKLLLAQALERQAGTVEDVPPAKAPPVEPKEVSPAGPVKVATAHATRRRSSKAATNPPSEPRARIYRMLSRKGFLDPRTGQLLQSDPDTYDRIFVDAIDKQPVPKKAKWGKRLKCQTLAEAWDHRDARRHMKQWLLKLIRDCASHRERIREERPKP